MFVPARIVIGRLIEAVIGFFESAVCESQYRAAFDIGQFPHTSRLNAGETVVRKGVY